MDTVACRVCVEAKEKVRFTWSLGHAPFDPYCLTELCLGNLLEVAEEARTCLRRLVDDELQLAQSQDDCQRRDSLENQVRQDSYALATIGYKLYQQLFLVSLPDSRQERYAQEVRQWLAELRPDRGQEKISVELILEGNLAVPWNVVYDMEPQEAEFLTTPPSVNRWLPFWGCRYYLAGGQEVRPTKRSPLGRSVLLVLDEGVFKALPPTIRQEYRAFAENGGHTIVATEEKVEEALKGRPPDMIYWLSHANRSALNLGDKQIDPMKLLRLLRDDENRPRFDGLAFLNCCSTGTTGVAASFFDAVNKAGTRGMVGTEVETADTFASSFGLRFLERFLQGERIAKLLSDLRDGTGVPLGLLYFPFCSHDMHVVPKAAPRLGVAV